MSSATSDSFTSSLPILMTFVLFSCLIAVARASNAMLNRSHSSRHPCLVPDFRGKAFSFSPMSCGVSCGVIVNGIYYVELCSFFNNFDERF